jgi:hypothetical protein
VSMDEVKADLKANLASVKDMIPELTTSADIVRHLKSTFWPFVENLVAEIDDIDDCVAEIAEGSNVLQEDTAQTFAGLITSGAVLVGELKRRLGPDDEKMVVMIQEYERLAATAGRLLEDIVMATDDDDDDEDEDENEDDDQDDDDEEDDDDDK